MNNILILPNLLISKNTNTGPVNIIGQQNEKKSTNKQKTVGKGTQDIHK